MAGAWEVITTGGGGGLRGGGGEKVVGGGLWGGVEGEGLERVYSERGVRGYR